MRVCIANVRIHCAQAYSGKGLLGTAAGQRSEVVERYGNARHIASRVELNGRIVRRVLDNVECNVSKKIDDWKRAVSSMSPEQATAHSESILNAEVEMRFSHTQNLRIAPQTSGIQIFTMVPTA